MISDGSEAYSSGLSLDFDWTVLAQLGLEGLALLGVALYCVVSLRRGLWAWVGLFAGLVGAVANGLWLAAYGQPKVFGESSVYDALFAFDPASGSEDLVSETLAWVRVGAVVVLAIAFVMGRRPRPNKKVLAVYETDSDA